MAEKFPVPDGVLISTIKGMTESIPRKEIKCNYVFMVLKGHPYYENDSK